MLCFPIHMEMETREFSNLYALEVYPETLSFKQHLIKRKPRGQNTVCWLVICLLEHLYDIFFQLFGPFNLERSSKQDESHYFYGKKILINITVSYLRYQAHVDVTEVLPLHLELKLPEGLDKGHALNVSHRASKLLAQNTNSEQRRAFHACQHNHCHTYRVPNVITPAFYSWRHRQATKRGNNNHDWTGQN